MFCEYCGAKMSEGARFCPMCGKSKAAAGEMMQSQKLPEMKTKTFNFGGFSHNRGNSETINQWLSQQSIRIAHVSINTFMNNNFIHWETVVNHMEIQYYEVPNASKYQFGFFKNYSWIGHNFNRVSEALETWKKQNSNKTVVWSTLAGHQASGGSTQAAFFLYRD